MKKLVLTLLIFCLSACGSSDPEPNHFLENPDLEVLAEHHIYLPEKCVYLGDSAPFYAGLDENYYMTLWTDRDCTRKFAEIDGKCFQVEDRGDWPYYIIHDLERSNVYLIQGGFCPNGSV